MNDYALFFVDEKQTADDNKNNNDVDLLYVVMTDKEVVMNSWQGTINCLKAETEKIVTKLSTRL